MVGGIIGLVATIYLKPRRNRFSENSVHQMSSPTNALLGTFMLWWGWFGINSGSAWGVTNGRWRLAARASVATIMSSIGGGVTSITFSFAKTRKLQVNYLIFGLLSSVVAITAICAVARPWHALLIGAISSTISISVIPALEFLKIDDPVGIIPIHLTSSIWGMCAVGIFAEDDQVLILGKSPLGIRVTDYEEQIGADVVEHGLAGTNIARYHVEKPLSSKTFATVTKAITKWKIQTRANRALREQNAIRGSRREPDGVLIRQRKSKLSNDTFFPLSHRSRHLPSRVKMSTTPSILLSSNIPKQGNLLSQQFRHFVTPFRKKEENRKYETVPTAKRSMNDEDGKNPNYIRRISKSNFIPIMNSRFTNDAIGTLQSLNLNRLQLDHSTVPVQVQIYRRSLDHDIVSDRRVLQCVKSSTDSENTTRIVTSDTSFRNKILPLISDAV
ncbi:unnamed protein product [Acanthocheilonema viteae]|uniref:Ammonium transporter AmtB-like domain-containing protein n=1 Tax=Acanthocheilonema viteae TaxID=6277 RepID=A0A498SLC4_ACAVI|nr:unnamed protein product [Acanthocheilonema viteae]